MENFTIDSNFRLHIKPSADPRTVGDGLRYIGRLAEAVCKGKGLDIGPSFFGTGAMPLLGAIPVDIALPGTGSATDLSQYGAGSMDYAFNSHCLEHVADPEKAVAETWRVLRPEGVFFLYLPYPEHSSWDPKLNPDVRYEHRWQPTPLSVLRLLTMGGFRVDYLEWEKDQLHSFACIGRKVLDAGNRPAGA